MNAKDVLLKWLNGKLQGGRNVKNFTTDWNDGTLLCELVNALEPGLISPNLYLQGSWPHRNVTVAMETAEKAWGIPDIISADDMTSSEVDELSVMTYVSLFFEYDLQSLSTNHSARLNNGHVNMNACENDRKNSPTTPDNLDLKKDHVPQKDDLKDCRDAGKNDVTNDGVNNVTNDVMNDVTNNSASDKISKPNNENIHETKPEMGRVGKVVEYILNLHDVKANEITVSVEYKASGKLKKEYKPDLKVFSLGKGKFRVKYTPNVAGNYRLSLFYQGEHIGDSPYCLKVPPGESVNGKIADMNNNAHGQKHICKGYKAPGVCNGITEQVGTDSGFYGFDGDGLKRATVGKLAVFTVITDNNDKGPLSVCINCPAVSIPVPHVKTTHSLNYSTHTVTYMPTLAGTYNIYVRWGLRLINGAPFHVEVTDHHVCQPRPLSSRKGSKEFDKKRQSTEFSHIKVYHSSSSLDQDVVRDTADLEELLARYGLTKGSCDDIWVSMDVELERDEREMIFRLAGTRRLPLVFIHEKCLGGFKEVYNLAKMNELEENLKYKVRKV